DVLDFTVAGLPDGLVYDSATRQISGTPYADSVGSHTIQITAADGRGGQVEDEFVIDIISATADVENLPPTLSTPIFDQKATEDEGFSLSLDEHFSDPDGDTLNYSVNGLPTSLFYDSFSRSIVGTPTDLDLGSFRVQVTVTDGEGGRFVEEFFLDIIAADAGEGNNDPFLAKPLFDTVIGENETVAFSLDGTFEDPDGDELKYEVTGLPTSLFVDRATNSVVGAPTALDVGSYLIEVTAFDGKGGQAQNEFVLDVLAADVVDDDTNTAPNLLRPLLDRVVSEGEPIFVDLDSIFGDADGDSLTYAVTGLPPSFFFDRATGGISGQPTPVDVGSHVVSVTSSDGRGGKFSDEFILNVVSSDNSSEDNTAPNLIAPLIDQDVLEGEIVQKLIGGSFEDKDGDQLQFTVEGLPTSLFLDPATNTIIGTPTPADVGAYSVRVTASDGRGGQLSDQFFLNVLSGEVIDGAGENTAPQLVSPFLDRSVDVGTAIFADLSARFEDPDGDPVNLTVIGLPPSLFFDAATNAIIGTPEDIDIGSYLIQVGASDGLGGRTSSEFFLTVVEADLTADNTVPILSAPIFDAQLIVGDLVSIPLQGTFADEDGDTLEYVVSGLPPSLFVDPATNSIVGTLTDLDVGSFSIEVSVFDGRGGRNFDEFFLDILAADKANEENAAPQLIAPFLDSTVEVGTDVFKFVSDKFEDPDGDFLTFTVSGLPSSLFFDSATNSVIGTPAKIDIGSYLVEIGVSDGRGGNSFAEFFLDVVATDAAVGNSSPFLSSPLFDEQATAGDQIFIELSDTFEDPDGDELEYVVSGLPTSLFVDTATNSIIGTLTEADVGSFSISVSVFDGRGGNNFDEFSLDILSAGVANEENTAPQLVAPLLDRVIEVGTPVTENIGNKFQDVDGDVLSYTAEGLPASFFVDSATSSILGTPTPVDVGSYSVIITASDGRGGRVSDQFLLTVFEDNASENNTAPTLVTPLFDQEYIEGDSVFADLNAVFEDVDGDILDYAIEGLPTSLFLDNATNSIIGTLTNTDVGTYTVRVAASDGRGGVVSDEFFLNVVAADAVGNEDNTAPTLTLPLLNQTVLEGDAVFVDLLAVFTDADGDSLNYEAEGLPPSFFIDDATSGITGTPTDVDLGSYTVTVTAFDGRGGQVSNQFILTVASSEATEGNTAPTLLSPLFDQFFSQDDAVFIDLGATFFDAEGDALTYAVEGLPAGLLLDSATNAIIGTPTAADLGTYAVTVTASDGRGGLVSDEFFLDIMAPDEGGDNNPPILNIALVNETLEEGEVVSLLLDDTFVDPDGDFLTYTVGGLPSGLFHDTATNQISGTLTAGDIGSHLIDVLVSDDFGGSNDTSFVLDVIAPSSEAGNNPPLLVAAFPNMQLTEGDVVS
ncbi:MAG: putative Ig domain-containing protein, partial [Pseudomonadales bacterium]|nr:putative Ig domain-containing protein [Pseudomonadales bacterium]